MDNFLKDKHILVTGASSGIGRQCAETFHSLGAKLSLVARRKERLDQLVDDLAERVAAFPYDLADLNGIEKLIQDIVIKGGKLDGMMFCAGMGEHVPIKMNKPDYSIKVMTTNYFSFAETLRIVSNARNCNPGASLIGMSSVSGLQGDKGLLAYSASKGAMNSAIRCAAVELAGKKIRVNGIATGYIGGTGIFEAINLRLGSDEVSSFANSKQLFGIGEPKDIAYAAAYLLSDYAKYVTGTIMLVDGGYMA